MNRQAWQDEADGHDPKKSVLNDTAVSDSSRSLCSVKPPMCSWLPGEYERQCQERSSFWHEAYGEICAIHAAKLMVAGEKVASLIKHRTGIASGATRRKAKNAQSPNA